MLPAKDIGESVSSIMKGGFSSTGSKYVDVSKAKVDSMILNVARWLGAQVQNVNVNLRLTIEYD